MSRKTKTNPAEEEARPRGKKRRFGLSRRERAERFATSFYMFPSLAGVLTFFILPFFVVIYYSLIDDTSSGIFVGIDNFTRLFENSAFKLALRNTGLFSVTAVPLVVVLALALAVLLGIAVVAGLFWLITGGGSVPAETTTYIYY